MTTYTVSSGHTSSGITLNSGDQLVVLHGGVAVATTWVRGLWAHERGLAPTTP